MKIPYMNENKLTRMRHAEKRHSFDKMLIRHKKFVQFK